LKSLKNFRLISTAALFTAFILVGCGSTNTPSDPIAKNQQPAVEPVLEPDFHPNAQLREPIGHIYFDNTIPPDEYTLIAKDLHALRSMVFARSPASELQRILKLPNLSAGSMLGWLEERIHYIVNENYGIKSGSRTTFDTSADNYGTWLFEYHLADPRIETRQEIPGIGEVMVTSPRVGIVRLGPAMFSTIFSHIGISESIMRLATLFHEARHSDGKGKSLGFNHACPKGFRTGQSNCDNNENGPYTIDALFVKVAMDSCSNCSAYGKEIMKLFIASSNLCVVPGSGEWDDTPQIEQLAE
jgi:hypothetical protein